MKKMHFLAFTQNGAINHAIGMWRHPRDKVGYDYARPAYWQDLGRILERGKFDAIFLADQLAPYITYEGSSDNTVRYAAQCPVHDPSPLVPIIAGVTKHLGIGLTLTTTFEHPYTLSRRLATLDHLTGGRVGWNIVTSYSKSEFRAMGIDDMTPRAERYARVEEFMDVCYRLWSSWDDDAIVRDTETGVFADPDKVKAVEFAGKYYKCDSRAFVRRSPQGHPVLWQAGSSPEGRSFASRHAEAIFNIQPTVQGMRGYADDIRAKVAAAGRNPDDVKIFFGVQVVIGDTPDAAVEKAGRIRDLVPMKGALCKLGGDLGFDFSKLAPDDDISTIDVPGIRGQFDALLSAGNGGPISVAEAATMYGISLAAPVLVGTGEQVADQLEHLLDTGGGDGFMIMATYTPGCFQEFVDDVVPVLQRRNRFRNDYAGPTLRENLLQT